MLVAIMVIVSAMLTSCKNDDDIVVIEKEVVKHDTVVKTDTLYKIIVDDLHPIVEDYLEDGRRLQNIDDYEWNVTFFTSYKTFPYQGYFLWLGFIEKDNNATFFYSLTSDERTKTLSNYQELLDFYETVAVPAQNYVKQLKEMGYGTPKCDAFLDEESFLQKAFAEFPGDFITKYGYILFLSRLCSENLLFGI